MQPLRDYQVDAVKHICRQHRVLLGDEQGLGKTRTALTALLKLCGDKPDIIVFGPRIALGTWQREGKKWFGIDSIIYSGESKPHERDVLWEQYLDERPPLLVATYAMIDEILSRKSYWKGVVADEYHKAGLMNHRSLTFKKFSKLRSLFLVLATGTPVKKGPQNLFAPFHLINPYKFPSYWKYVYKHCVVIPGDFGQDIEPRPKRPAEFKEFVRPYLIRRTKKKVLKELPPLQRQAIDLEMTAKQKQYYEELAETGILKTPQGIIACANEAVKLLRLRQLLVTPKIFGFKEKGAALSLIKEVVSDSFDSGQPVAICTPFRPAVDAIAEELQTITPNVYKIHGSMKVPATTVANMFQTAPTYEKVILYTTTSGMSWDAYAASNLYCMGAEWTAIDNKQAESRLHRLGQEKSVMAYYMLYPNTIDQGVLDRLDENQMAANWVLDTQRMLELLNELRKR